MSKPILYEQSPLTLEEQTIRVLSIEPGIKGTMIKASMSILYLNDLQRAPYNTLSYTWGESTIVEQILVNDELIGVGANLYQALQHIRSSESPINIWIDAVCINQTDNMEKAHQVSRMDLVYRLCERVYIWLGCSETSGTVDDNPFALVEHFASNKHFHALPGYYKDVVTGLWNCDTENAEFVSMWKAFGLVASSTWWHRAWTARKLSSRPRLWQYMAPGELRGKASASVKGTAWNILPTIAENAAASRMKRLVQVEGFPWIK